MNIKQLFENAKGHFHTINTHKIMVMKHCFKVGLFKQGLLHDLSKYSPIEFIPGVKYFQGFRSPNAAQRDAEGYSGAWLHHKGRNKHHYEYWIDYPADKTKGLSGMKMPVEYVVEMFCDRVAASKIYHKENYTDATSLEYYKLGHHRYVIHPESDALLRKLLIMLARKGEDYTFRYIRQVVLKKHS